jgi:RHS repeat-associated protein
VNGRTFTNAYAYDAASNRTSFTDPENGVTTYAYDNLNRLTSLTDFNSNQFGFTYDALSRRTQLTRPNGVNTDYTYDNLSRLLSILHKLNGNTIDGAIYTVDNVGNRTTKLSHLNGITDTYTYDAIYQLTQVVQNPGGTPTTTEAYTYDAVGNRLSDLTTSNWTYNSSNHLTSRPGVTYTCDNNGNTATKSDASGTTTYTWDHENRLTSIALPGGSTVSFKYDPFGRRIHKSSGSGTTNFAYDGANIVEEANVAGAVLTQYVQHLLVDEPLASLQTALTSFQTDGHGSVSSLSDNTGGVSATYDYNSFGQANSTGNALNRYMFTAREWDSDLGVYYYRARYYAPDIGRFLSDDSLRFGADINFYVYAGNAPTILKDPFGRASIRPRTTYHRGGAQTSWCRTDPHVSCVCKDGGWQAQVTITIDCHINYSGDSNFKHESQHVGRYIEYWRDYIQAYERYERWFSTKEECDKYWLRDTFWWPGKEKPSAWDHFRDDKIAADRQSLEGDDLLQQFIEWLGGRR